VLSGHAQRLAAGGQHGQVRAACEELHCQLGSRIDHVLAVVEDQQQAATLERIGDHGREWPVALLLYAQCTAYRAGHGGAGGQRRQLDPPRAIGEAIEHLTRRFEHQAGLAHAARTNGGDQARVRAIDEAGQVLEFTRSPDKGRERGGQVAQRRFGWFSHGGGCVAATVDGLVQLCCLALRFCTELLLQQPFALAVLPQRGGTLARSDIEAHQCPVGGLVQRVECQPAAGVGDRRIVIVVVAVPPRQPLQGTRHFVAQSLPLKELPFVERRRITEGKAGHERVTVELHCLFQEGNVRWTGLLRRMPVRRACC
jgi:hypothetical protein